MRTKTAIVAILAAISLGAFASGAYAGPIINLSKGLQLTEAGKPVAWGAAIENEQLFLGGHCLVESNGKLLNNGDAVDVMQFGAPVYSECQGGGALTGGVQYAALSDTGTALFYMNPTLTLTSGSCSYSYTLLSGSFPATSEAYITGEATGQRAAGSSSSCARTQSTEFTAVELGLNNAPLGAELISGFHF